MPSVQDVYNNGLPIAFAGMIADTRPNTLISKEVETAVPFGKAVAKGTAQGRIKPFGNVADKFEGIAVRDVSVLNPATPDTYPVKSTANVLVIGPVWVVVGAAVADQDPVYIIPASGKFTNVSNSNANYLITDAVFETDAAADGDLARIALK